MPKQPRGRHRAPRPPRRPGALALPVVLLGTGGGAVLGLAGPLVPGTVGVAVAQVSPIALPAVPYGKDLDVLDESQAREEASRTIARQRARAAAELRASRSRRVEAELVAEAAAEARAAAEAKAAAEEAVRLAAEEAARPKAVRPASGPLTSPYGQRWGRLHAGIDFGSPYGSPVRSVLDGTIVESGFDGGGYGNFVRVQHSDGVITTYNHMSKIYRRGGEVQAGDVVGLIGSTGHSTGPHLHFEVRTSNGPINPRPWLRDLGIDV